MKPEYREKALQHLEATVAFAEHSSGWYNAWILFRREIKRFLVIIGQSILSPVVTTLLYFLVFGFSLGRKLDGMGGIAYMDFLTPGLIMLALITNSFINSSFSFFLTKVHGSVVDIPEAFWTQCLRFAKTIRTCRSWPPIPRRRWFAG